MITFTRHRLKDVLIDFLSIHLKKNRLELFSCFKSDRIWHPSTRTTSAGNLCLNTLSHRKKEKARRVRFVG